MNVLVIWDKIFAVGENLKLTYYLVVAMIIHVRDRLLPNDMAACAEILTKYPKEANVDLIIRHSLYMLNPQKYDCPANAFVNVVSSMRRRPAPTIVYSNLPPRASNPNVSSSPRRLQNDYRRQTARATRATKTDNDGIVEGYLMDDPNVLKIQLQDSVNIMAVSRMKLVQYLSVLRRYIPGNRIDELNQVLDGIEELCSLLEPKFQYVFENAAAPVDPAFEASDEFSVNQPIPSTSRSAPPIRANEVPNFRFNETVNDENIKTPFQKSVEMKSFHSKTIEKVDQTQFPIIDPPKERDSDSQ